MAGDSQISVFIQKSILVIKKLPKRHSCVCSRINRHVIVWTQRQALADPAYNLGIRERAHHSAAAWSGGVTATASVADVHIGGTALKPIFCLKGAFSHGPRG